MQRRELCDTDGRSMMTPPYTAARSGCIVISGRLVRLHSLLDNRSRYYIWVLNYQYNMHRADSKAAMVKESGLFRESQCRMRADAGACTVDRCVNL